MPARSSALSPSLVVLATLALIATSAPARAQSAAPAGDHWRFSLLEENDSIYFESDKHYTQGLRIAALSPTVAYRWANDVYDFAGKIPTVFPAGGIRRAAFFVGQSIFTPKDLRIKPPDPRDEPYAGWLYAGASLLQETGGRLENLELDLGVIGPGAFGRQVQNDWHQFVGVHQAEGWSNQLQNEPGAVLSYERLWHVALLGDPEDGGLGVDVVPEAGATVGNVFTYGDIGGFLRFGKHLETDYGPVRVRPALSGTDYFNPDKLGDDWGYYLFAGTQGRVVGRDVFLDGNTFRHSAHVTRQPLAADFDGGVTAFKSTGLRLTLSIERRTREFVGQPHPDVNGTVAVAFTW